jgi:hypothetical protein
MFPQIVESYLHPDLEDGSISSDPAVRAQAIKVEKESFAAGSVAKYWYPTLVLNLDVKKLLPDEGVEWLFVRVRAKEIKNGRLDLDIEVWDDSKELVATSTHASLIVDASRNTAGRGEGSDKPKKARL